MKVEGCTLRVRKTLAPRSLLQACFPIPNFCLLSTDCRVPASDFRPLFYVRAAGLLLAWSRIVSSTLFGTCSNVSGSIEYDARPLDSERMAVA